MFLSLKDKMFQSFNLVLVFNFFLSHAENVGMSFAWAWSDYLIPNPELMLGESYGGRNLTVFFLTFKANGDQLIAFHL